MKNSTAWILTFCIVAGSLFLAWLVREVPDNLIARAPHGNAQFVRESELAWEQEQEARARALVLVEPDEAEASDYATLVEEEPAERTPLEWAESDPRILLGIPTSEEDERWSFVDACSTFEATGVDFDYEALLATVAVREAFVNLAGVTAELAAALDEHPDHVQIHVPGLDDVLACDCGQHSEAVVDLIWKHLRAQRHLRALFNPDLIEPQETR